MSDYIKTGWKYSKERSRNLPSDSNNKNIENRTNRGAVSEIISALSLVALGHFHFETSLILRDSILVSKLVYSSEIWYNLTSEQLFKLEGIVKCFWEEYLIFLSRHLRSVYMFCVARLRYIIKTRRLLFYWHFLQLDEKELLYRFLTAQTLKPSKNDWILELYTNMDEINLKLGE